MKASAPRISVVVPTYDRADRLERLLPILEERSNRGLVEVIIVDDGSCDGTSALLADQPWAKVVRQANGGAASARNAGWHLATAPVVAFIDDDCLPGPAWPIGLLGGFGDASVAGVGGRILGTDGSPLDVYVAVERLVDHGRDVEDGVDYLVTANAAFRLTSLVEVGGFDEDFPGAAGEDVDLSWRVRRAGGRLVRSSVKVNHDHRSTVADILKMYQVHGRARSLLDDRHPQRPVEGSIGRTIGPTMWLERWRSYRERGIPVWSVLALLCLRAAGLACFGWGVVQGRRGLPRR